MAMTEQLADVGRGVTLCYESFGSKADRPLLLVMGLGSQMIFWDEDFCAALVGRGFYVIRFDNRDCGRSTVFDDSPPPTTKQLLLRDKAGTATRSTTSQPTRPVCSARSGSRGRTSSAPRWAG